jgi:hypothetical protein
MSPQRLLCPLWHESLAQPLTSWVSGRPGRGRFVYGSAGLAASDVLFGNELRNPWLTCAAAADLGAANPPVTQAPSTPAVLIAGSSWGLRRGKTGQSTHSL